MASRVGPQRRNRMGHALVVLTLLSHLMGAFGFPLPAATGDKPATGPAFPCQDRPCGCTDSTECWAGDCCCFTLEEKLQWAEVRGVEPPAHVRPMVESRKAKPPKKPAACCCEGGGCEDTPAAEPSCCSNEPAREAAGVRWVVGLFAKKCRADGPAGLFDAEPSVPPAATFERVDSLRPAVLIDRPRPLPTASHVPPTPPPRSV